MKIIVGISFSLVLMFCSEPLFATETVPGEYRSPPVGTTLIYSSGEETITRIKGVKVYKSLVGKDGGTYSNHLVYHGIASNWTCGSQPGVYLKFTKSGFRSPWPLRVGGTYAAKFALESSGCRSKLKGKVLRTETVTVPAGTFFTYVLSEEDRFKAGITATSFTTKWYAPRIGVFVKIQSENDCTTCWGGGELMLLDIRYPSGYEEPKRPTKAKESAVPKSTSDERLRKLKDIYDKGLIDEDEYLAKINEINGENVTPLQGKLKLLKRAFEEGLLSQGEYDEKKKKILDAL
jgi:hypothetical protein